MKILIAEDDYNIAFLYKRVLEMRQHDVYLSFDGTKCLQLFEREYFKDWPLSFKTNKQSHAADNNNKFDLVILDIDIPERNGIDIAREIHNISPNQRILLLSDNVNKLNEYNTKVNEFTQLREKPITNDQLVDLIEHLHKTE